jgi:hypothetical protein
LSSKPAAHAAFSIVGNANFWQYSGIVSSNLIMSRVNAGVLGSKTLVDVCTVAIVGVMIHDLTKDPIELCTLSAGAKRRRRGPFEGGGECEVDFDEFRRGESERALFDRIEFHRLRSSWRDIAQKFLV